MADRTQTPREELANALSHALGCVVALLIWPLLVDAAAERSGAAGVLAASLFCGAMCFQYAASAIYHGLAPGRAKQWAKAVDHAAIFIFIAGSSSPFTLGVMGGTAGAATCALIWTLALAGASLKLRRRLTNRRLSTGLYVLLGWFALIVAWPQLQHLDATAFAWLLGGGGAYMVGTLFFVYDEKLRFGHLVWHLFALAGSACHVFAAFGPALF
jgi:hemolysin III